MASTLGNSTALQNVSFEHHLQALEVMSEQTRSTRPTRFDHISSMATPLSLGTGFGTSTTSWGANESIWSSGTRASPFLDGSVDTIPTQELSSQSNHGDAHFDAEKFDVKKGSKSLLLSSESDNWTGRANVPWKTTVNTTSPKLTKPQHSIRSPTRDIDCDSARFGQGSEVDGTSPPSYFSAQRSGREQMSGLVIPKSLNGVQPSLMQRPSNAATLSGFSHDGSGDDRHQAVNTASFTTNSTRRRRPFQNFQGADYDVVESSPFDRPSQIDTTQARETSAGQRKGADMAPSSQPRASSTLERSHLSHNTSLPFHRSVLSNNLSFHSEFHHVDDRYDEQNSSLPTSFEKINLHNELLHASAPDFQTQMLPQRSSYNSSFPYNPSLSKPRFNDLTTESTLAVPTNHAADKFAEFQYSPNYQRSVSFGDRGSASPNTSEYRRGFNSPWGYSTTTTPPMGYESLRSTTGSGPPSRASNGQIASLDRRLRGLQPYQSEPQYLQPNPLYSRAPYPQQYESSSYPAGMRMNPLANPYQMQAYSNIPPSMSHTTRYPAREPDASQIIRSPLLEDFRTNNKTNKRYELKDIYNHVVEFSGDQHGSRFIQQKLETANSDEKDQVFAEIQPNSLQLMTDVFGNYVIQKLFEHGNQSQKKILANQMKGHVVTLSTQMYGCRVVQKALEHILTDQQASMVKELENHVMKCVKDQNGNHVIQKAIERVPAEHIQFIMNAFTDQVQRLATHPYGCRVIQRMLEHSQEPARQTILRELHACVPALITDQFGNYVVQHVIENGAEQDKSSIIEVVIEQLLVFSKHKFASNVVEKSIEFGEQSQRAEILRLLTAPNEKGESPVLGLMRDQYGNYVIQKVFGQLKGSERAALVTQIKPHLTQLKKFSYGKQIIAIERLIFDSDSDLGHSTSSQSSTLPSTNASTVEGPIAPQHLLGVKSPATAIDNEVAAPDLSS